MADGARLYRHYSAVGDLLYVGVSLNVLARFAAHISQSDWASETARIDVENFPTREEALAAERRAIRDEVPRHNVYGFAEMLPKKRGPSKGSGGRPSKYPAPTDDQLALLEKWWAGPLHWQNVAELAGEMLKCETPNRNWMIRLLGKRPPCKGRERKRRSDAGSKRNAE